MLTVGDKFPELELDAVVSLEKGKEFAKIHTADHRKHGKWMVMFFWPKDFTFVCPTEIKGFNDRYADFRDNDAVLYGASTDTAFVHLAWRRSHEDLHDLRFPMLSDHGKHLSRALGILYGPEEVALRATFIVDPAGIIQWVNVNNLDVGRNVDETLRVLEALQTGELCPCNWKEGEKTLKGRRRFIGRSLSKAEDDLASSSLVVSQSVAKRQKPLNRQMEETRKDLLADLGISDGAFVSLDAYVKGDYKYIRDLRINLKNVLESPSLGGKKNAYLLALAVAVNERCTPLILAFTEQARKHGASEAEIAEMHAIASLLATNNVLYRFRHFSENKVYEQMPAGIKMTIMARPTVPKVFFELVSLAISAVNGCEVCVNSHEKSVREHGGTQEMIFDAIRLAAVVRGLAVNMHEIEPAAAL